MSRFTHKFREKFEDLRKRHWGKDRHKFGKCAPLHPSWILLFCFFTEPGLITEQLKSFYSKLWRPQEVAIIPAKLSTVTTLSKLSIYHNHDFLDGNSKVGPRLRVPLCDSFPRLTQSVPALSRPLPGASKDAACTARCFRLFFSLSASITLALGISLKAFLKGFLAG